MTPGRSACLDVEPAVHHLPAQEPQLHESLLTLSFACRTTGREAAFCCQRACCACRSNRRCICCWSPCCRRTESGNCCHSLACSCSSGLGQTMSCSHQASTHDTPCDWNGPSLRIHPQQRGVDISDDLQLWRSREMPDCSSVAAPVCSAAVILTQAVLQSSWQAQIRTLGDV